MVGLRDRRGAGGLSRPRIATRAAIALLAVPLAACGPPATTVAAPAAPATAAAPSTPISLAVGDVVELEAVPATRAGDDAAFGVRVEAPAGARFVAVLVSTRMRDGTRTFRYAPRVGPPEVQSLVERPDRCSAGPVTPAPDRDDGRRADLDPARARAAAPSLGATRTFQFRTPHGPFPITARAVAVGDASVVWADASAEHPAQLDEAFAKEFLGDFERVILPRARTVFGAPSDRDGDGRVALLFTPLTSATGGIVAFFSGCDLAAGRDCAGSNEAELLYLTPPNAIAPPYNTPRAIKEILAHELEHLVHHDRKVVRHGKSEDPDAAYLLEGFGALAQDTVGFQAGNLYVTAAGLTDIDDVSLADLLVPGAEYDRRRDGALRGAAYLLVRWLYDRAGGDRARADGGIDDAGGPTLVHGLLDASEPVAAAIAHRTGSALADVGVDFYTTLALADAKGKTKPCWSYLPTSLDPITGRQRGADLHAEFHGMALEGPSLQDARRADGALREGGVDLLAFAAKPGDPTVGLTVRVDRQAQARLRIVRIQ